LPHLLTFRAQPALPFAQALLINAFLTSAEVFTSPQFVSLLALVLVL